MRLIFVIRGALPGKKKEFHAPKKISIYGTAFRARPFEILHHTNVVAPRHANKAMEPDQEGYANTNERSGNPIDPEARFSGI